MSNIFLENFVRKYVEKWQKLTPRQKWKIIYNIGGILSEAAGVTVYTTMKRSWYTYAADMLLLSWFVSVFYTIWYYFRQGEYFRGVQGTCAVGIVFSVNYSLGQIYTKRP